MIAVSIDLLAIENLSPELMGAASYHESAMSRRRNQIYGII
jgi:hypothetical protein